MKKLTGEELAEIATAAKMSEKLVAQVMDNQREIAVLAAEIEAIQWPGNLFGSMGDSLEQRDYQQIELMLTRWDKWLGHDLPVIRQRMEDTATIIRAFVNFFKMTNSVEPTSLDDDAEDQSD